MACRQCHQVAKRVSFNTEKASTYSGRNIPGQMPRQVAGLSSDLSVPPGHVWQAKGAVLLRPQLHSFL